MTTQRQVVEAGGRRLEVARSLPGAATSLSLVFLHEGLGSVSSWRDFPWQLGEEAAFEAIVYSRYGHGESEILREPRGPEFMHREAVVLAELLRRLEIAAPVLIGHSDGASIALLHAAAEPSVRGLVLLAPHVFVEERSLAGIRAARDAFASADLALRLSRHHRDPLRTFRGWNDVWLDPRFRAWDIRAEIRRIGCPVLAVQGEDDEYGTMAQLDEIAARAPGPVAQLRVAGCGHSPHRVQPEPVREAILRFVRTLTPDTTPRHG